MKTVIGNDGQVTLPSELRRLDHLQPGEELDLERLEPGRYLLKRHPSDPANGLVDWLRSCPEQEWFQALPSESTEAL